METLSKNLFPVRESHPDRIQFLAAGLQNASLIIWNKNLEQNVSLDMLAQSMNYSAAYLSRLIKKNTGQSFSELLLYLRLKSMELLRLTDMRG